ncbi:hypothetical protein [Luteimonas huabeiensis]|uniref:hypothetical protein n=1 Tax=Luteimonas huabeiensis TaxID=1244513 RepID=UPI00046399B6|nr:hypothetical protein [Luteimonas huabeiensis]
MGKHPPPAPARGPLEKTRAPDVPRAPGEYPGKRDQDERNDPEAQPGAAEGNPARRGTDDASGRAPPET